MQKDKLKLITAIAAAFAAGILVCAALLLLFTGSGSVLKNTVKYACAMRVAKQEYVAEADLDTMTDTALAAAFSTLDEWSYYMTARQYEDYVDYVNNRYRGIGVTVSELSEGGGFKILDLTADGPAAEAGVQVGEVIIACDGVDVTDKTVDELKELISSACGEWVELTLLSPEGSRRLLSVECREIKTESVTYELLDDGVGYLRISNFEAGTADSAISAIEELCARGASALVADVRSNPGGRVTELCELLDYLLPEGDIFIRADKQGSEQVERSDADYNDIPMAVLINGDSYSAAEFFAAALAEYDRAITVGEATGGKGRSQLTYTLADGSAIHLSHYVYLTPQRVDLSAVGGIVPDIEQSLSEETDGAPSAGESDTRVDAQLTAAINALMS